MDTYLTCAQVAEALQVDLQTLYRWRKDPDHPLRWRRVGQRGIRYARADVEAYLAPKPANA